MITNWTMAAKSTARSAARTDLGKQLPTHAFDDVSDATIRPARTLGIKLFSVDVCVAYRDGGTLSGSSFTAEGLTAKQAEAAALNKARYAIAAGGHRSIPGRARRPASTQACR